MSGHEKLTAAETIMQLQADIRSVNVLITYRDDEGRQQRETFRDVEVDAGETPRLLIPSYGRMLLKDVLTLVPATGAPTAILWTRTDADVGQPFGLRRIPAL